MKEVATIAHAEMLPGTFCILDANGNPQEEQEQERKENAAVPYGIHNGKYAHDRGKNSKCSPRFEDRDEFAGERHVCAKHLLVEPCGLSGIQDAHGAGNEMIGGENEKI